MTKEQREALERVCARFGVPFVEANYGPTFDLPAGWVAGVVGPIYVGCSPDGEVSS